MSSVSSQSWHEDVIEAAQCKGALGRIQVASVVVRQVPVDQDLSMQLFVKCLAVVDETIYIKLAGGKS